MSFEVVARLKLSVDKDCLACAQAFVRNSIGAPVDNDILVEGIQHIEEDLGYEEGEYPGCPQYGKEDEED